MSCVTCHFLFSLRPCPFSHFRYLVIRVISVMGTANGDADLDLKAVLTIVNHIGCPSPTCVDSEWFLERGLPQDIPIILFTKGLGFGHEGLSCKTQRIENGTWQWQCRGYDFGCASSLLLSGYARATAGSSP